MQHGLYLHVFQPVRKDIYCWPMGWSYKAGITVDGSVAERSKALVLGTSLFGGVGSNPTPAIRLEFSSHQTMINFKRIPISMPTVNNINAQ